MNELWLAVFGFAGAILGALIVSVNGYLSEGRAERREQRHWSREKRHAAGIALITALSADLDYRANLHEQVHRVLPGKQFKIRQGFGAIYWLLRNIFNGEHQAHGQAIRDTYVQLIVLLNRDERKELSINYRKYQELRRLATSEESAGDVDPAVYRQDLQNVANAIRESVTGLIT